MIQMHVEKREDFPEDVFPRPMMKEIERVTVGHRDKLGFRPQPLKLVAESCRLLVRHKMVLRSVDE